MRSDPRTYPLAEYLQDLRSDPELSVDRQAVAGLTYRQALDAALNGTILAKRIKGRWHVEHENRQRNAELLGVTPRAERASSPSNAAAA